MRKLSGAFFAGRGGFGLIRLVPLAAFICFMSAMFVPASAFAGVDRHSGAPYHSINPFSPRSEHVHSAGARETEASPEKKPHCLIHQHELFRFCFHAHERIVAKVLLSPWCHDGAAGTSASAPAWLKNIFADAEDGLPMPQHIPFLITPRETSCTLTFPDTPEHPPRLT